MKPWTKEIIEQICLGLALKQSTLDSGNRLALICVDNAVEVALKFYASYHQLLNENQLGGNDGFYRALCKVKDLNKINGDEESEIRQYHNTRNDLYHRARFVTVRDGTINDYGELAKKLLEVLFDFKDDKKEWNRLVLETSNAITEGHLTVKIPVTFEPRELDGVKLVKASMSAANTPKNTEAIMVVIYGYTMNYLLEPNRTELAKSLMLSGKPLNDNLLNVSVNYLRRNGYLNKDPTSFKLQAKATKHLEKKFAL